MELLDSGRNGAKKAEKLLMKALEIDEHSAQTYVGLVYTYGILKNKKKAEECIKKAYDETVKKFPIWPKEMPWGDIDNRAYMRAIQYRADLYADEGEKDKAIELYRLLLRLNPNDNQGVRYTIAGVYAGISGKEINKMFDEGNEKQNWDKLKNLVKEQNVKYKFWEEPKF
jgi:tetratricopeptide (TPR) repeat protein